MKKSVLIFNLLLLLTSCFKEPVSTENSNNSEIKLAMLFEKDGCKVYRFFDGGRAVYYTDCRGKVEYSYYQKNGNNSGHSVYIQNETSQ